MEDQAGVLFEAPFVVLSHGTQADPILNYGNRLALQLWELDVATLLRTPSRSTAEPGLQQERGRMIEQTRQHGFFENYQGIRVSLSGRRFLIEGTIIWNLLDSKEQFVGQAATFSSWRFLDSDGHPAD